MRSTPRERGVVTCAVARRRRGEDSMLDPSIEKALNQQINNELKAWYTYLAMSAYFDGLHLGGFAGFMENQAREEQAHAHRLFRYVLDRGARVELQTIAPPRDDYNSVLGVFDKAVESERHNTEAIHELYELARGKNDYATIAALQWFLDEQVEEEKLMTEARGLVRFAGDDKSALLALNGQFGKRSTPPES
jgi:ferritin